MILDKCDSYTAKEILGYGGKRYVAAAKDIGTTGNTNPINQTTKDPQ